MKIDNALPENDQTSLSTLRSLQRNSLKGLFATLDPPSLETLDGEYDAELLQQGNRFQTQIVNFIFSVKKNWIGKAFEAQSKDRGVGYNCFREGEQGDVYSDLPMSIYVGTSQMDGRPSVILDYGKTTRLIGRMMIGEVRRYSAGVLLGFGTIGPVIGRKHRFQRSVPFALVGPIRPLQIISFRATISSADRKVRDSF
jgi:hypothetical protein